jgi:pSer/pThr/pTyr-binding forkhead associated (FHA) protein
MSEGLDVTESRSFIIGREGHIYVSNAAASKHHAQMTVDEGKFFLRDLDSTNGTYLLKNKKLVHFQEGYVHPDQPIVIGSKMYTARKLLDAVNSFYTN